MAYQRLNVQKRVSDFLSWDKEKNHKNVRVRPGFQVNPYLENYEKYISDPHILQWAINESEKKQEGTAISINFNLSAEASRKLAELKGVIDAKAERHLYPAQVLDILLICVRKESEKPSNRSYTDQDIAIVLNELVGDLIAGKDLSISKAAAKQEIVSILMKHDLL